MTLFVTPYNTRFPLINLTKTINNDFPRINIYFNVIQANFSAIDLYNMKMTK